MVEASFGRGALKGHGLWGAQERLSKGHVLSLDDLTPSAYNRPLNGAAHA
jgi:hypothetical protein